jgi:Ca2+-binding RTX toxin-like protein
LIRSCALEVDSIYGLAGDDDIEGEFGSDILVGGTGDDTLDGSLGGDTYIYEVGDGNDVIFDRYLGLYDTEDDIIFLGSGINDSDITFTNQSGAMLMSFQQGGSIWVSQQFSDVSAGIEYIRLSDGTLLNYGDMAESFADSAASSGNDLLVHTNDSTAVSLDGGAGHDELVGNVLNDTLIGGLGDDVLRGLLGDDILTDDIGEDTLIGGGGNDSLTSGADNDDLFGGAGNDTIIGGQDGDIIYTGDGYDMIIYNGNSDSPEASADYIYDFDVQRDVIDVSALDAYQLTLAGIGKFLKGSYYSFGGDLLYKFYSLNNDSNNSVYEFQMQFDGDVDLTRQNLIFDIDIVGDNANNSYTGTSGGDAYHGLGGDDTANGLGGNDTLMGGAGDDFLSGGDGLDRLFGGIGENTLIGGLGSDKIFGSEGQNIVRYDLGDGNDTVEDFTDSDILELGSNISRTDVDLNFSLGGIRVDLPDGGSVSLPGVFGYDGIKGITLSDGTFYGKNTLYQVATGDGVLPVEGDAPFNTGGSGSIADWTGTNNADSHTGTSDAEFLVALAGNDTVDGAGGDDTIDGGEGNDSLLGGDDADILNGNEDVDTLKGGNGDDTITGGTGNDFIYGNAGADIFTYETLADATSLSEYIVDFDPTEGDKIDVTGLGFTDIQQGSGSGTVLGYTISGSKTWILSDGNSFAIKLGSGLNLTSSDFIGLGSSGGGSGGGSGGSGGSGGGSGPVDYGTADWTGTINNDSHNATSSAEYLVGLEGNDFIDGKAGADTIMGGVGQDSLRGRDDADIFVYQSVDESNSTNGIDYLLDFTPGEDFIDVSGLGFTDIQSGNASGTILGYATQGDGKVHITNATGDFDIKINTSSITLASTDFIGFGTGGSGGGSGGSGGSGGGSGPVDYGTADWTGTINNDSHNATSSAEYLVGLEGNDFIDGKAGADTIMGGVGQDSLRGRDDADIFVYQSVDESNSTNGIDYLLDFTPGEDFIDVSGLGFTDIQSGNASGTILGYATQGDGKIHITNAAGDFDIKINTSSIVLDSDDFIGLGDGRPTATITGTSGSDSAINGTSGNDVIDALAGDDTVYAGGGDDIISGREGNDFILGDADNDTIYGDEGNDDIYGFSGADDLLGGDGNDLLSGEAGADTLTGGQGVDSIYGGTGADEFVFLSLSDSGVGSGNRDYIDDFTQGVDLIDMTAITPSFGLIGTSSFSSTGSAEIRQFTDGTSTILALDNDGNGIAELELAFNNSSITFVTGDFV